MKEGEKEEGQKFKISDERRVVDEEEIWTPNKINEQANRQKR